MSARRRLVLREALDGLEREVRLGDRYSKPVSLVMLDVDDFEIYRKNNGELSGKKLISNISRLVRTFCRETDIVARLGREDLTLILPQTTKVSAGLVAERLLEEIGQEAFPGEAKQPGGKLTLSVGVATYPGDADNTSDLIQNADRALYLAKSNGKNRVQLYDDNRRSRRRKRVALDGVLSTIEIKSHPLRTKDLSPSGVKFSTSMLLPVGALIDLRLEIPGSKRAVKMAVRVLRLDEVGTPSFGWIGGRPQTVGGSYEIAARTVEIGREDLRALTQYLWNREIAG